MKINELRVGNLVTYGEGIYDGGPITAIAAGVIWVMNEDLSSKRVPLKDAQAIKLNEYWLRQFDFKAINTPHRGINFLRFDSTGIYVTTDTTTDQKRFSLVIKDYVVGQVEYVHELQNLFYALTKTELIPKDEAE